MRLQRRAAVRTAALQAERGGQQPLKCGAHQAGESLVLCYVVRGGGGWVVVVVEVVVVVVVVCH